MDAGRKIMKLSRVSRFSPGYTDGHWLAWRRHWPAKLPRTREENLLLAQVNRGLGLQTHPQSHSQLLYSPGFSPPLFHLLDPVPYTTSVRTAHLCGWFCFPSPSLAQPAFLLFPHWTTGLRFNMLPSNVSWCSHCGKQYGGSSEN